MFLQGLHEKDLFTKEVPFRIAVNTNDSFYYPQHWHSAVEFLYVKEGSYSIVVNEKNYHMNERDILVIAGGDIHSINSANNPGCRFFIQFDLSQLIVTPYMAEMSHFISQSIYFCPSDNPKLHAELEKNLVKIIDENTGQKFGYMMSINARLQDIIVAISRSYLDEEEQSFIKKSTIPGLHKINKLFQYIEQNYCYQIMLKDAAMAIGFSESYLSRLFKSITGKKFHQYLNEVRITKALRLLQNEDCCIITIAHECGFNSISTFNRIFKKIKGCTPTKYLEARD